MPIASPLTLVGYEDDVNLREVTWNQNFLEKETKRLGLKHGQAVVYSNVAKSKVRLIAVFYGITVLILPPIDPADKVSLYLKINQFLRRFKNSGKEMIDHLTKEIEEAKLRLEHAEERRKMAIQASRNRVRNMVKVP